MSLYQHIAGIYDELFPLNRACIQALETLVPKTSIDNAQTAGRKRRVLDLGCATGTLIAALEERGWETLGIELDPDMAARARGLVLHGSMLDAEALVRGAFVAGDRGSVTESGLTDTRFDAILCLGNTLPHIRQTEYHTFFESAFRILAPGGRFIIQTLNYGNPLVKPGFVFPPIVAGSLIFNRRYEAGSEPGTLVFATDIDIEGKRYSDTTNLYIVEPEALDEALRLAGFAEVCRYAGWNLAPPDQANDLYSISVAIKP